MSIKQIGIGIAILFIGMMIGASGEVVKEIPVEKEVIKEVPVEKIVEVEKNGDTWRRLKEIDDQGFIVAGESMELCSAGFYAVSQLDVNTLEAVAKQIPAKNKEIEALSLERNEVLVKLGY